MDRDFKTDIKKIRKEAQKVYAKALTPKFPKKALKKNVNESRAANPSPTRENTLMVSNVIRLAESIQDKISKFSEMMLTLKDMENKHVKQYTSVFSDSVIGRGPGHTENARSPPKKSLKCSDNAQFVLVQLM